ncbi:MAG: hypothetical protein OXH14_03220 [Alphaproteobacteria bacterium]|nr:hypothetical protein [Alphaproteobacteria bacterium]
MPEREIEWGPYIVAEDVAALVDASARRHGLPPNVLRAHVVAESHVNGRVRPAARAQTEHEDSVGLLQLNRDGGQGVGYSVAQLSDPAINLEIGTPPIAAAWAAHPELGHTRARVLRTAAESGHPGDPSRFRRGSRARQVAETGTRRVADAWETLEEWRSDQVEGNGVPLLGVSNEAMQRVVDGVRRDAQRLRPRAAGAVAVVLVLGLAVALR